MKKFFIIIRNIFIGIFLVIYFSFIILISTLLLNRNDYGVTEFGDKALILVDEEISNENYKAGTLVIIERKKLTELEKGQEVFVYQPDKKDKSVNIVIANIAEIFPEDDSPYITLANNGSAWGEEYVGGTAYSTFDKLGSFLKFIESKWVFFILLIIPCFFILLYEVYLLIIAIKFDDYEDDEEEVKEEVKETQVIKEENEETNEDKLSYIEKQIMELKANSNSEISEVVEDKNEKIDDLMQQISALRKEYDEKNTFTQEIPVLNENDEIITESDEIEEKVEIKEPVINNKEEKKPIVVEKQEVINKKVNKHNQNNNKHNQNKQNNNKNNNKHNHKNNNNQRNNNRNHNKNNNNNKNRNNNKQKN